MTREATRAGAAAARHRYPQRHQRRRDHPYPQWGAYGASKAARLHLSRIWDTELASEGVRVLALAYFMCSPASLSRRQQVATVSPRRSTPPTPSSLGSAFLKVGWRCLG
jgi:NAD(P)-dependent dehydrogenase (short-subunit alcohol dehydrogenase family)